MIARKARPIQPVIYSHSRNRPAALGWLEYDRERGWHYRYPIAEHFQKKAKLHCYRMALQRITKGADDIRFPDDPVESELKLSTAIARVWDRLVREAINRANPDVLLDPTAVIEEITVNGPYKRIRDEVLDAFYEPIRDVLGDKFKAKLDVVIDKSISDIYQKSSDRVGNAYQIAVPKWDANDRETLAALKNNSIYWISTAEQRVMEPDINRALEDIINQGLDRREGAAAVKAALQDRYSLTDNHWQVIASAAINRSRVFAQVEQYAKIGVESYEIVAVLDERTTEVCKFMNGKIFKVKKAHDTIRSLSQPGNQSPDEVKQLLPWVSFSSSRATDGRDALYTTDADGNRNYIAGSQFRSGRVEELGNIFLAGQKSFAWIPTSRDTEVKGKNELHLPPYHANCRTTTVISEEDTTIELRSGLESPTVMPENTAARGTKEFHFNQAQALNTYIQDIYDRNQRQFQAVNPGMRLSTIYDRIEHGGLSDHLGRVVDEIVWAREELFDEYLKYCELLSAREQAKEKDALVEFFCGDMAASDKKLYKKLIREGIDPIPMAYLARLKQEQLIIEPTRGAAGRFNSIAGVLRLSPPEAFSSKMKFKGTIRHEFAHAVDSFLATKTHTLDVTSKYGGFYGGWRDGKLGDVKPESKALKKIFDRAIISYETNPWEDIMIVHGDFLFIYEGRVYQDSIQTHYGLDFFGINSARYLNTKEISLKNFQGLSKYLGYEKRLVRAKEMAIAMPNGYSASWQRAIEKYGTELHDVFEKIWGSIDEYIMAMEK